MTQILLGAINGLFRMCYGMLHPSQLPQLFGPAITGIRDGITFAMDLFRMVNFIVPIPTIFQILTLDLMLHVMLLQIWLANKIIDLIAAIIP